MRSRDEWRESALLGSLQHNVHTPFDLLFLAAGYWTLLSSPAVRLFKQRNCWATEDQTEFLSSVLLVGQLDEIIAGQAATDKVYVDSENCFDLVSPVLF